jgi:hypothetical protein
MHDRLEDIARRFDEMAARMGDPAVYAQPGEFQKLAKEVGQLEPLVKAFRALQLCDQGIADAREMADAERDPELRELARTEFDALTAQRGDLADRLRLLLLPKDPNDEKNVLLEIRAGTGGEEASLFAADLFRMYARYAERKGWRLEVLDASESESRGFKEVIALVSGQSVYSTLKFEAGVHRVQRVPEHREPGAHPHLGLHRGHHARGRGRRAATSPTRTCGSTSTGPAANGGQQREHHRLAPCASRTCRRTPWSLPGREEPAQEQGQGHEGAAARLLDAMQRRAARRAGGRARASWWAAATAPSGSAPTTSRRTGSRTTAST